MGNAMSGIGGKGGSQTSEVKIPEWLEDVSKRTLGRAEQAAQIGYTPYSGPDVAAFTPMQNAAFQGTNQAAEAFGMPSAAGNGMPAPETFAGGVQGHSSKPLYDQAIERMRQSNPQQYAQIMAMFGNQAPGIPGVGPAVPLPEQPVPEWGGSFGGPDNNRGAYSDRHSGDPAPQVGTGQPGGGQPGGGMGLPGGYRGPFDMIDGGGPGEAGGRFQGGGLLSGLGNLVTGRR